MGKYDLTGIREQKPLPQELEEQPKAARKTAEQGRAPGKRSRPDYSRTTVYMRDETKLKAVRLLQDLKDQRDLSDLIESLVAGWTSKHSDA